MKTKRPPYWIYYASIAYISTKMRSSMIMMAYLWSNNDDSASCTVNSRQGPQQGMKLASGKIAICSYYSYTYSYSLTHVYSMTAHSWLQILPYK